MNKHHELPCAFIIFTNKMYSTYIYKIKQSTAGSIYDSLKNHNDDMQNDSVEYVVKFFIACNDITTRVLFLLQQRVRIHQSG